MPDGLGEWKNKKNNERKQNILQKEKSWFSKEATAGFKEKNEEFIGFICQRLFQCEVSVFLQIFVDIWAGAMV